MDKAPQYQLSLQHTASGAASSHDAPAPPLACDTTPSEGLFSPIISTSTETDDQRAAREAYHLAFISYHTTKTHTSLVRLRDALLARMKVGA